MTKLSLGFTNVPLRCLQLLPYGDKVNGVQIDGKLLFPSWSV